MTPPENGTLAGTRDPAATKAALVPDPVGEMFFKVSITGVDIGYFTECSGLQVEIGFKEYDEGGENRYWHKLRGRLKYPNLVFKRGITHEDALLAWLLENQESTTRREGFVSLCGPDGKVVRKWKFTDAFPVKWTGPNLNAAASNSAASETLEIAHHGFQPEAP